MSHRLLADSVDTTFASL